MNAHPKSFKNKKIALGHNQLNSKIPVLILKLNSDWASLKLPHPSKKEKGLMWQPLLKLILFVEEKSLKTNDFCVYELLRGSHAAVTENRTDQKCPCCFPNHLHTWRCVTVYIRHGVRQRQWASAMVFVSHQCLTASSWSCRKLSCRWQTKEHSLSPCVFETPHKALLLLLPL